MIAWLDTSPGMESESETWKERNEPVLGLLRAEELAMGEGDKLGVRSRNALFTIRDDGASSSVQGVCVAAEASSTTIPLLGDDLSGRVLDLVLPLCSLCWVLIRESDNVSEPNSLRIVSARL
jgi:hypothetical protein